MDEQVTEYILMGLRTHDGIDLRRLSKQYDTKINAQKINYLKELGFIIIEDEHLKATRRGRPILNALIRELIPD
jgi:oxygen-independent coproporphyrinogen-3 oxidase